MTSIGGGGSAASSSANASAFASKSVEVLERSRLITAVVFDKTRTRTKGEMALTDVVAGGVEEGEVLRAPARWEPTASTPSARRSPPVPATWWGDLPAVTAFSSALPGPGLRGDLDGTTCGSGGATCSPRPG